MLSSPSEELVTALEAVSMETDMGGIQSTAQAYAALCQGDMLKARKLLELGNEKFFLNLI